MRAHRLLCVTRTRGLLAAFCTIFAAVVSSPVSAAGPDGTTAPPEASDMAAHPEWSVDIAPYFWAAGMTGTVASFGAAPVNVDMDFSDIFGDLNFSIMAAGEARYGRFSLTMDLLYLKLSTSETTPRGILLSSVGLDSTMTEVSALAGYSVLNLPNARVDAVLGGRLWSVENGLSFNGGLLGGRTFKDSATWVDAMGGLKGRVELSDRFYLTGTALAGGGGSNFGWDLMGGLGYQITDRFSAVAGYRAMGVDYQDGPFEFDVTIKGPIMGASLKF